MKVLVVGGGGRDHALTWSLAASPLAERVWCAPGNPGIAAEADCVPIAVDDIAGLVDFAAANAVDLVVVGPEQPLVAGLVDRLTAAGLRAFGPTAAAARLEGSKRFMKDLCRRYGIPTADHRVFTEAEVAEARAYVEGVGAPIVVKADGLAAGKGVVVADTVEAALAALDAALVEGRFGDAGRTVVVEAFLDGPEISLFALSDGQTVLPFASARDYKRVGDGDRGPNTGGMGAVSPHPLVTDALLDEAMTRIIRPTVAGMAADGHPFQGVLYAGLVLTEAGLQVMEFNVRFGDPEAQAMVVRLRSDLLPVLLAGADRALHTVDLRWRDEAGVCVVLAAQGYPGPIEGGSLIFGLPEAAATAAPGQTAVVFQAATRSGPQGVVMADGGRVLGVTATGAGIAAARTAAYAAVDEIAWHEGFCRRDIAAGL